MFIFTKGLGLWRWMREESYQRQRRKMCLKCSNNPSSETISTSWGLWGLLGYMVSWSSGCQVSPGSFSELKSYFMQWKFSRNNVDKTTGLVQWLSRVWLFPTPWTVARKAPLFMGFPRQEYWSGLPFCFPGESSQLRDGTQVSWLAGGFFPTEPPGKPRGHSCAQNIPSDTLQAPVLGCHLGVLYTFLNHGSNIFIFHCVPKLHRWASICWQFLAGLYQDPEYSLHVLEGRPQAADFRVITSAPSRAHGCGCTERYGPSMCGGLTGCPPLWQYTGGWSQKVLFNYRALVAECSLLVLVIRGWIALITRPLTFA